MRSFIIAALLAGLPTGALACGDVQALLAAAYPNSETGSDEIIVRGAYLQRIAIPEVDCRAWPYKPEITLLAVPLIEADPVSPDETKGDVEILVVDSKSGKLLARRREAGMAYGDAINFSGLSLDTARYDVRSGERAFGIVTEQGGSSRVNPYSERALWLYRFADGRLERVLDGLVTRRLNGENNGDCTGETREISRTVSITKTATDGYRDLTVEQSEVNGETNGTAGDCVSTETPGPSKQFTLRFENGRYRAVEATEDDNLFSSIAISAPK